MNLTLLFFILAVYEDFQSYGCLFRSLNALWNEDKNTYKPSIIAQNLSSLTLQLKMDYNKLSHAELRTLCKQRELKECFGKGITSKKLTEKLRKADKEQQGQPGSNWRTGDGAQAKRQSKTQQQKKSNTATKVSSVVLKTSIGAKKPSKGTKDAKEDLESFKLFYKGQSVAELRKLCAKFHLKCPARATKPMLIERLIDHHISENVENDSQNNKDSTTDSIREDYLSYQIKELKDACVVLGIDCPSRARKVELQELIKSYFNTQKPKTQQKIPQQKIIATKETILPKRKESESSSGSFSFSDTEKLSKKILGFNDAISLRSFCERHMRSCQRENWDEIFRSKNEKLYGALKDLKTATSWQTLYIRMIDFFDRFKSKKNLDFITPESLHRDYGDIWIALVRVYPTIRRTAIQNNDLEVVKSISISHEDAKALYSKAGSREMAQILFLALKPQDRALVYYESLSVCNENAISVMKDAKVKLDLKKAIEASLTCETSIRNILRDPIYSEAIQVNIRAIINIFYLQESAGGLSELLSAYPTTAEFFEAYHLVYLAREGRLQAIKTLFTNTDFPDSSVATAFEAAALRNARNVVAFLLKNIRDQAVLFKIFASSIRMNRLGIAKEVERYITKKTLQGNIETLKDSLKPQHSGKQNDTQRWADSVIKRRLNTD